MTKKYISINTIMKESNLLGFSQKKKYLCGDLIGCGHNRNVYVCKKNPNYVVKLIHRRKGNFANILEFENFVEYMDNPFIKPYLAEVLFVTDNGEFLIQERANWAGKKKGDYPKRIPALFSDLKYQNFGWMPDGRFVCFDYVWMRRHYPLKKMQYVKWRTLRINKKPASLDKQVTIW